MPRPRGGMIVVFIAVARTRREPQRQQDVLQDRQIRQQIELLENVADVIGAPSVTAGSRERRYDGVAKRHCAALRAKYAREQPEQRRLAAAAWAMQEHMLAGIEVKRGDVQDGFLPRPGESQVMHFEQGVTNQ